MKDRFGKKRVFSFGIIVLMTLLIINACSTTKPKDPVDDELYTTAEKELSDNDLEQARLSFERLLNIYPDSKYRADALIRLAEILYKQKNYLEARIQYQKFIQLYPVSKQIDKAYFFKGMSYFKEIIPIDRDQSNTEKARKLFKKVLAQYPDSEFIDDANKNLLICNDYLAQNILYIAKFYYHMGKFNSVIYRLNEFINRFPESSVLDEVYYYLGSSYIREEKFKAGIKILKTLQGNYPNSEYNKKAEDIMAKIDNTLYK